MATKRQRRRPIRHGRVPVIRPPPRARSRPGKSSVVPGRRIPRLDRLASVARPRAQAEMTTYSRPSRPRRRRVPCDDRALDRRCIARGSIASCRGHRSPERDQHQRERQSRQHVRRALDLVDRTRTPPPRARAPMSPGPKQIAGIPAALRSAASVHAVIPSMRAFAATSRERALERRTIGAFDRHIARRLCEKSRATSARKSLALRRERARTRHCHSCSTSCRRLAGNRASLDSNRAPLGIRRHARSARRSATRAPTAGRAAGAGAT